MLLIASILLLLFLSSSIGCLTDNQCPSAKPFCNPSTSSCEACYTDAHCKNNTQCNAICTGFTCGLPPGQGAVKCSSTQVCYEFNGKCLAKCTSDTDCSLIPTVIHHPNTGVCDIPKGKCYDCLVTADCKPYRNETCGSKCSYNPKTLEYLCGDGNLCAIGTLCKDLGGLTYQCSNGNILNGSYIWALLGLLFIICYF